MLRTLAILANAPGSACARMSKTQIEPPGAAVCGGAISGAYTSALRDPLVVWFEMGSRVRCYGG
jgi:hypothetical protein